MDSSKANFHQLQVQCTVWDNGHRDALVYISQGCTSFFGKAEQLQPELNQLEPLLKHHQQQQW